MANEHMKRWSVFLIMKIQKKKKKCGTTVRMPFKTLTI